MWEELTKRPWAVTGRQWAWFVVWRASGRYVLDTCLCIGVACLDCTLVILFVDGGAGIIGVGLVGFVVDEGSFGGVLEGLMCLGGGVGPVVVVVGPVEADLVV